MSEHYQIVVIGSGPGGYIAALKAAQMGARAAIVEKHHLGGTCLNYGCIPSKALLASSELLHKIRNADTMGVKINGEVSFDWPFIQKRKDKVLNKLRGGIQGLLKADNVALYQATAKLTGPGKIHLDKNDGTTEEITADNIIVATGSVPSRIPGWPDDPAMVCTSDESLHWDSLPERLLIVGGGVIGCEFACMMHEFGVQVVVVEMMDGLLPEMERSLGAALETVFKKRGIQILTGTKVEDLQIQGGAVSVKISGQQPFSVDRVLVATGRRAATSRLGLETVGLETDRGFIRVDNTMQSKAKGIYCIGDANGRCLLAHAASAHGEIAVKNALGKSCEFIKPVPAAVYTFPEIASVGLTSRQARDLEIPICVGQFPIGHLGKAMAVGEETGFVRVLRQRDEGQVLGVHMIGHNATEVIEAATAMIGQRGNIQDLAEMVFAHPTIGEAMKEAAEDAWHGAVHLPPRRMLQVAAEAVAL